MGHFLNEPVLRERSMFRLLETLSERSVALLIEQTFDGKADSLRRSNDNSKLFCSGQARVEQIARKYPGNHPN